MVKLKSPKGEIIMVTSGAAKQFKNLGFVAVEDEEKTGESEDTAVGENKTEKDLFIDMVKSKPISELTKDEVQRFVKINGRGRELKGKNLEEARLLVKEIIDEISE